MSFQSQQCTDVTADLQNFHLLLQKLPLLGIHLNKSVKQPTHFLRNTFLLLAYHRYMKKFDPHRFTHTFLKFQGEALFSLNNSGADNKMQL